MSGAIQASHDLDKFGTYLAIQSAFSKTSTYFFLCERVLLSSFGQIKRVAVGEA